MKIEIWSDIMCPFCYIGKRHLEKALESFPGRDSVEITWKSYQLDPTISMAFEQPIGVYEYLAERKGWSLEQSEQMHDYVVEMAASVGLEYNFDKAVVANSLNAHRVIQLAKEKGLDDAMEEIFFRAYFTEGRDLASISELVALGEEVGLGGTDIRAAIASEELAYRVSQDIQEGVNLGLRGVPFFVFDRKYGISGAEPIQVFIDTLNQTQVKGYGAATLVSKRRSIVGSMIGGIAETQEMLDYCAEHNILSDIEMISMQDVNAAYERVIKSDVKYRFVIDMKTL